MDSYQDHMKVNSQNYQEFDFMKSIKLILSKRSLLSVAIFTGGNTNRVINPDTDITSSFICEEKLGLTLPNPVIFDGYLIGYLASRIFLINS
jgi:hypothetical protein